MILRPLRPGDAEAVARLHAASWASAYRGLLRDDYLDGPVADERLALWQRRRDAPVPGQFGVVAESDAGGIDGFAFAFAGRDPRWGTLLDNLHVRPDGRGRGLGRRLLHALADQLMRAGVDGGLHLEVLDANHGARSFYQGLGALAVQGGMAEMPDGSRLREWTYAWPSIAALHAATAPATAA